LSGKKLNRNYGAGWQAARGIWAQARRLENFAKPGSSAGKFFRYAVSDFLVLVGNSKLKAQSGPANDDDEPNTFEAAGHPGDVRAGRLGRAGGG
jgi:hypothetical protein